MHLKYRQRNLCDAHPGQIAYCGNNISHEDAVYKLCWLVKIEATRNKDESEQDTRTTDMETKVIDNAVVATRQRCVIVMDVQRVFCSFNVSRRHGVKEKSITRA